MNSYFFLTSTIQMGTDQDPAKVITQKYTEGRIQIYYGNTVGVCAIERTTDPDITEVVQMKTRQQVIDLVHPNLPGFVGATYIDMWENPKAE